MGPGGEFDLIRQLVTRWGSRAQGIGDDAAILEPPPGLHLVASVDSAVEGVHFRRDWLSAREIGYRAAAAALSDLAAMAATPLGILVALAIPREWLREVNDIADGIGDLAGRMSAPIVGGNVSRAPTFSITTTVLGAARTPLTRGGVCPGHLLYLTGRFGGPGAAIHALERGRLPDDSHRDRFARPVPRIPEAQWLAERGATAAIDISDGLLADLQHLAAASRVHLSIDLDRLPTVAGVEPEHAASSGEEYELAVSTASAIDTADFEAAFGIPLTRIGVAVEGPAGVAATIAGKRVAPLAGHDHFSG